MSHQSESSDLVSKSTKTAKTEGSPALESVHTYQNEHLTVKVTQKPHCVVVFDITVAIPAVKAAYQRALRVVNKEVSVPGFRKGRAPDEMIEQNYSSVIYKEFVDTTLQVAFNEAIQLTQIHPLKENLVKRPKVHECVREKPASFTVEFESRPILPEIKLEELEIQRMPRVAVSAEDRANALLNLRLQLATYTPVEDRAAQPDDFVTVSVTLLGDHPQEVIRNQRAQVNDKGLPLWLQQKVIGLKVGESCEGVTEQDLRFAPEDPNFKSMPFRLTLHAISIGELPEVNDELAKKVGLETMEELYQKLEERLENEIEEEAFAQETRLVEQLLVERFPFDVPQSYIDANKENRFNSYMKGLETKKINLSESEFAEIEKTVEAHTLFDLRLFFLSRKIAADHHIAVDSSDITKELNRQVALISTGRCQINFEDKEHLHQQLQALALERKIKEFLVSHVRLT